MLTGSGGDTTSCHSLVISRGHTKQWRIVVSGGPGTPNSVRALCNGETQRLPAGALEAPGGVRGRAPEANAFCQQHC